MLKNKNELLESMKQLKDSLRHFITELEVTERVNDIDINDLIVKDYPFKKDLYETHMDILEWFWSISEKIEE